MTDAQPASKDLFHHQVSRELGIEIIEGQWSAPKGITLEDIQKRFGVSRTVAREASRQLESMGLLTIKRRSGLVPQDMQKWQVLDPTLINWRLHSSQRAEQIYSLTQLRLAIEPAAAESAAKNQSIHERAKLLPLAAEMRRTGQAGELKEFMRYDIEFHRHLLQISGNELFAALADLIAVVLKGRTELGLMPDNPKPEALLGHEEVAQAIFAGDSTKARESMQTILDEVRGAFSDL